MEENNSEGNDNQPLEMNTEEIGAGNEENQVEQLESRPEDVPVEMAESVSIVEEHVQQILEDTLAPEEVLVEENSTSTGEVEEPRASSVENDIEKSHSEIPMVPDSTQASKPASAKKTSKTTIETSKTTIDYPDEVLRELEELTAFKNPTIRDIDPPTFTLFHSFGFQSHKRSNLHFLNQNTVLSSVGNLLGFLDLKTGMMDYLKTPKDGSIGAITVHPSKRFFAVGEMAEENPYIYVYTYPSLRICRILKGGADRGYADLCFNAEGTKIASVACDPDYMLTVWSWRDSAILLRSKAFSQDVYRISFSQENDGILTSSGMGHIKFWRMSATFTGLKLQGYIGKFGASELTDIASFIQLPDGKVLSSTETGNLLLWDGGMIKCEIGVKGKKPCHVGKIEVILLGEGEIFTGGEDGYFRVWDLETIDNADVQTSNEGTGSSAAVPRVFEMEPLDEIIVGKDVKIKEVVRYPSSSEFLIQDQQGQLLKLDMNKRITEKIMTFHSGAVVGLAFSPALHQMATLGVGGNLRIYDYLQKQMVYKNGFAQGGSCIYYLPTNLDPSGSAFVAGFADGVIRIVSALPTGFVLHYVFKPHKLAVTNILFSPDGTKVVTTSKDGSLFLFHLVSKKANGTNVPFSKNSGSVTPIGFLNWDSPVSHVSFGDEYVQVQLPKKKAVNGLKLLVTLKDGSMFIGKIPVENDYDTAASYELNHAMFNFTRWSVDVPEKKVVVPEQTTEQEESKAGSQSNLVSKSVIGSKALLTLSLNSLRKAKGLVLKSDAPISASLGLKEDYMIFAVTNGELETEIRLFDSKYPTKSELICVLKEPVATMQYDFARQSLLVGSKKGGSTIIRFHLDRYLKYSGTLCEEHQSYAQHTESLESRKQKLLQELEQENPDFKNNTNFSILIDGQHWTGHLHDISQSITSFCSSFDSSFYATSGADGGIFLWRNTGAEVENANVFDTELSDHLASIPQPEDIVDSTAYSIQESKLKSEKDRELELAESKKQVLRSQIQELRNEFNHLILENESAPAHLRLDPSEIRVDPYLKDDIAADAKSRKEQLLKELAWNAEKDAIGAAKLKRKFLDPLKSERIQVNSFKSDVKVESFRTLNLDSYTEPLLAQLLNSTEKSADKETLLEVERRRSQEQEGLTRDEVHNSKKNQKKEKSISKLEARKQLRAERAAQWKQLMDSKPDDKYEDPQDVAAIRYAIANMGDYKLKTAADYIVPENERVNADKKKRQIILLNDSIKTLKEQFNAKVFAMRDHKVKIIERSEQATKDIESINAQLQKVEVELASFSVPVSKPATGTNGKPISPKDQASRQAEYERNELNAYKVQLEYEKLKINQSLENSISTFDQYIEKLAKERLYLAADLKFADIKLQLLFREWILLKEFEQTDNSLADKLANKKLEKKDIEGKIAEYRDKLVAKKVEIDGIIKQEKGIHEEYRALVGENNKHEEFLNKVFKRKVKRVKKKVIDEGESNEELDEDEDSDSDGSSYNSDEEGGEFEEVMPTECDASVWNGILELRERKLDIEEVLQEVQKSVELLKRENDALLKKEKVIDAGLKNTETEIQEFQTLKQRKLNELDVVVPLRLNQIQYLQEEKIPSEMMEALVFYNEGLLQLKRRIRELQQEKLDIKKQHRELKKQHVMFNKSKKEKQARVSELQEKARDVQMLKFGQIVDLEKLEKLGSNKAADELRDKIQKEDLRRVKELAEIEKQIKEQKLELMQVIQENTLNLERIVLLQEQKQLLEKELNQSQRSVNAEISGPPEKEIEEREKLLHLVQTQAQQIEQIKAEIESLIRKPTSKTFTYGRTRHTEHVPQPPEIPQQHVPPSESEQVKMKAE